MNQLDTRNIAIQHLHAVRDEIAKVMVGQRGVIEQMLWAVCCQGHVLLEGVPGLGKTLLVKTLAQSLQLSFQRIQFTPDLMPTDITGTNILRLDENGQQHFSFQPGPIFAHVVLADEINRATPKTQSALLEAMQEQTVSAGGSTRSLPTPFFVLATQNPLEQEGTYPLPEAQLDRFLVKLTVPFPTEAELREIVTRTSRSFPPVQSVASGEEIANIAQHVADILVSEETLNAAVRLLLATHPEQSSHDIVKKFVKAGAGPRGLQAMIALAKARAFMAGRFNISQDDLYHVAFPALRHRLFLNFEGEANGIRTDEILSALLREQGIEPV